jgi:hypothetical protein
MYFQLYPSMRHTGETESGLLLLKTPTRMDGEVSSGKSNPVSGNSGTLAQEIMSGYEPTMKKLGMLPTPTTMDSTSATANMKSTQVKEGSMHSVTLARALDMGMLPTPAACDYKGAYRPESMISKNGAINREERLVNIYYKLGADYNSQTSQLNPHFVLEMMGFPTDWTLLPFLNGEQNQSKQEEMP